MADKEPLPLPPEGIFKPERTSRILMTILKKKMRRLIGDNFHEIKADVRKDFRLTEEETRQLTLYALQLSRIACNQVYDELERRFNESAEDEE